MQPRLVTAHQAEQRLAEVGVVRSQARQVLLAGLAGAPIRRGRIRLYEAEAVGALLRRRQFATAELGRHAGREFAGFVAARFELHGTVPDTASLDTVSPGTAGASRTKHARRRLVLGGAAADRGADLADARIDLGRGKQWAYWAPVRKVRPR